MRPRSWGRFLFVIESLILMLRAEAAGLYFWHPMVRQVSTATSLLLLIDARLRSCSASRHIISVHSVPFLLIVSLSLIRLGFSPGCAFSTNLALVKHSVQLFTKSRHHKGTIFCIFLKIVNYY